VSRRHRDWEDNTERKNGWKLENAKRYNWLRSCPFPWDRNGAIINGIELKKWEDGRRKDGMGRCGWRDGRSGTGSGIGVRASRKIGVGGWDWDPQRNGLVKSDTASESLPSADEAATGGLAMA